jgi:hypothetical protein
MMLQGAPGSVTVTAGALAGYGLLEYSSLELVGGIGEMVERIPHVLVSQSVFGSLARGASITVGGTAYTVRDVVREQDGYTLRVVLAP